MTTKITRDDVLERYSDLHLMLRARHLVDLLKRRKLLTTETIEAVYKALENTSRSGDRGEIWRKIVIPQLGDKGDLLSARIHHRARDYTRSAQIYEKLGKWETAASLYLHLDDEASFVSALRCYREADSLDKIVSKCLGVITDGFDKSLPHSLAAKHLPKLYDEVSHSKKDQKELGDTLLSSYFYLEAADAYQRAGEWKLAGDQYLHVFKVGLPRPYVGYERGSSKYARLAFVAYSKGKVTEKASESRELFVTTRLERGPLSSLLPEDVTFFVEYYTDTSQWSKLGKLWETQGKALKALKAYKKARQLEVEKQVVV